MKEIDVVCGAIQIDDKFLIARRSKGADPGFWEFPGGKVEQNESREEALIRELKEELGVDVEIIQYLCSIDDPRENFVLHVHAFLCHIKKGTPHLEVHDEIKLVNACDLYDHKFQKADLEILNHVNKIVNR